MTRDAEFLALYADAVIVEAIHSTEIGYLIRRAADYYNHYQVPLPREVLLMMLDEPQPEGQKKLDKGLILKHYDEARKPAPETMPYMEEEAKSWFAKRIMRAGMREAVDFLEQGQVDEARAILNRSLGDSDSIGDDDYGNSLVGNVDSYLADLESLYGDKSRCIPCGMPSLDKAMGGGLRPGELALFMGPPKRGKSHGLIFVARHAFLQGYNVIYYTLEMSPTRIQNRIWSNIINRPAGDDFHQYAPLIEKQARHYAEHPEEVGSLVVQGYPAHQATVAKLHSNLVTLERREGWKPDLIVVDYGELLGANWHLDVGRDEQPSSRGADLGLAARAPPYPLRIHWPATANDHLVKEKQRRFRKCEFHTLAAQSTARSRTSRRGTSPQTSKPG